MSQTMPVRDRNLARSDAILDGQRDALIDLAKCTDMTDIAWYRRVAYDNLANGSRVERAYHLSYDHEMARCAK